MRLDGNTGKRGNPRQGEGVKIENSTDKRTRGNAYIIATGPQNLTTMKLPGDGSARHGGEGPHTRVDYRGACVRGTSVGDRDGPVP